MIPELVFCNFFKDKHTAFLKKKTNKTIFLDVVADCMFYAS